MLTYYPLFLFSFSSSFYVLNSHASVKSLNDMKNMIANLPQFQEMKTKARIYIITK